MSERDEAEFRIAAAMERDMLVTAVRKRLTDGAQPGPLLHGLAALLGECAATAALPGRLDALLDALAATMRANAALRMGRDANRAGHGHA